MSFDKPFLKASGEVRATLGFVGDVMLGELLENFRRGVRTMLERHGIDPFEHCRTAFSENDLNVANLECILADGSNRRGIFRNVLRAPARFVVHLANAPIHVVSIANNHALDHGHKALEECVEHLESAGVRVVGFEEGRLRQSVPVVLTIQGMKFGFWSFNLANLTPKEFNQRSSRILKKVAASAAACDRVIVLMHWGEEYTSVPPTEILCLGRELAARGASIICGHHSHRLQGVTTLGNAVFAPSMGNFIFDDRRKESTLTSILQLTIRESGVPAWESRPCTINRDFQPVPDPSRTNELHELNDKLLSLMEEVDSGGAAIRDKIARDVAQGHRQNRIRMRALMLRHILNYRGGYGDLLSYTLRRNRVPYSVSDLSEWITANE